jgi:hypothetical protein
VLLPDVLFGENHVGRLASSKHVRARQGTTVLVLTT